MIPEGLDFLLTHEPPFGIGDRNLENVHLGSRVLLQRVMETKPLVHVYGHIHPGHGLHAKEGLCTLFVNAAICDESYNPIEKPILIELVHQ